MIARLQRFFDVRPGEIAPVLLVFLYLATVVAAYLLAKPIRNSLFLNQFGAYKLVYVYVAVPLVLTVFVPLYTAIAPRFGLRTVVSVTLLFFCLNALLFWYLFTYRRVEILPAVFYVWVNCFGIIAPVQVWIFANSVFDTRQAKRLFGLIASGASLGAVAGGLVATTLIHWVGGTINLILVLAGLIAAAAVIVNLTRLAIPRREPARFQGGPRVPLASTLAMIGRTRYLTLIAASVFLVAVVTQWTQFQFSIVAEARYTGNMDGLTRFFGQFNLYLGIVAFVIQLLATGPLLRRFGIALTVLLLPVALGIGAATILAFPVFWAVLATNAVDQGLRFSVDKASYELLYLPMSPTIRSHVKVTIDTIINRCADAVGGVALGLATQGFSLMVVMLPGAGLEVRGIAALCLVLVGVWIVVALALRGGYVDVIKQSIQQHRLDAERASAAVFDRSANDLLAAKLASGTPDEILYALGLFEAQHQRAVHPAVPFLLSHASAAVRRRALAIVTTAGDRSVVPQVERLLVDPDFEVRTEALLYLAHHTRVDPVTRLQELGDFPDFSIRAGMVAFLSRPGRFQNLEASRFILNGMVAEAGDEGRRSRLEAARLLTIVPDEFEDALRTLIADPDEEVRRHAIRAAGRLKKRAVLADLIRRLGDAPVSTDASEALGRLGDGIVGTLRDTLFDQTIGLDIRREVPGVFVRIGTPSAERALMESLLEGDTTLRYRVIASLNKLRQLNPDLEIDVQVVEIALAAEIMGHYRSYQVLGSLGDTLTPEDPVVVALKQSMEQEVERIFRLLGLLFPTYDLHSAYFGLRSGTAAVRANALEFLDNILKPQLRNLLVPLLDSYVSVPERVRHANRLLGTAIESREQAVEVLTSSDDPWMRSCAAYAIGALQMRSLEGQLDRWIDGDDALLRETARAAKMRLTEAPAPPAQEEPGPAEAWEGGTAMGVG
jgi:AAA family ATP:ADP antiporter